MTDLLIPNLTDEVLSAIDQKAKKSGVSRTEYLRQLVYRDASTERSTVTVEDLRAFSEAFSDLKDPEFVKKMWE